MALQLVRRWLSSWSLNFPESKDEKEFKKDSESQLCRTTAVILTLGLATVVVSLLMRIAEAANHFGPEHLFPLIMSCILLALVLLLGLLSLCRCPCLDVEMVVMGGLAVVFVVLVVMWDHEGREAVVATAASDQAAPDSAAHEYRSLLRHLSAGAMLSSFSTIVPMRCSRSWALYAGTWLAYVVNLHIAVSSLTTDRVIVIVISGVLCLTAAAAQRMRERIARAKWVADHQLEQQMVDLEDFSALAQGMQTIANNFCDVVVRMTSKFVIKDVTRKQTAFFGRTMEGTSFIDLLSSQERTRFDELLSRMGDTHLPTCMSTTLNLRGGATEVVLLLVDLGKRDIRYLVGISLSNERSVPSASTVQSVTWDSVLPIVPGALGENSTSETSFRLTATTEGQQSGAPSQMADKGTQVEQLQTAAAISQTCATDSEFEDSATPLKALGAADGRWDVDGAAQTLPAQDSSASSSSAAPAAERAAAGGSTQSEGVALFGAEDSHEQNATASSSSAAPAGERAAAGGDAVGDGHDGLPPRLPSLQHDEAGSTVSIEPSVEGRSRPSRRTPSLQRVFPRPPVGQPETAGSAGSGELQTRDARTPPASEEEVENFDGEWRWVMDGRTQAPDPWLQHFVIQGEDVVFSDGTSGRLQRSDTQTFLVGGVLRYRDGELQRVGRSGVRLSFRRAL